ncbi:MAG: hypothetical protein JWQ02_2569, partial [Capsulimonas sp.]|nr:hypothetical protein [Capsulimonas sp.]
MISIFSSRRKSLALAGALALLSITAASPVFATSSNAPAWERLWNNDDAGAKTAFKKALAANPKDADALRGLGWIAYNADDKQNALQFWSRSIALAPSAWTSEALWPYAAELDRALGAHSFMETAAKRILADSKSSESLKTSARLTLVDAADRRGDVTSAKSLLEALHSIRDWRVIGPFDNVSKSGFEKIFAPEQGIDLAASVAGREGQPLKWRKLQLVSRQGECAVGSALGDGDEDVFYATTAVRASSDGTASFAFSPTGASKIYCNGRLIFSDDVYRVSASGQDVFHVTAPVRKGWNTLLVKLADDEGIASAFRLRILETPGVQIEGVDSGQASGASVSGGPLEAARSVLLASEPQALDIEAALMLGHALTASKDYERAENVLRKASSVHPSSAALHWELSQTLAQDQQADEARGERETALKQNRGLALAALNEMQVEKSSSPAPEQLRLMKALSARFPASSSVVSSLADAYDASQLSADALKTRRRALKLAGGPDNVISFAEMLREDERKAEALALIKTAAKTEPADTALLGELADLDSDQGNGAAAISLYQRLIELEPEQPLYANILASLYTDSGDHTRALSVLHSAIERRPQNADLYAALGDSLRELHKQKEALTAYQTAVALAPDQPGLRTKLEALSGQKPVLDLVAPLPTPPLKKTVSGAKETGSLTYLVDDGRQVVYPDYATVFHVHVVVRINDAAAAQAYQTYPMARSTAHSRVFLEQARVIKVDGKIEDGAGGDYSSTASFPSLAPGDTIDISYRVEDYQRGGLAHQFWGQWGFTNYGRDVRISRFALITPTGMEYQTQAHGGAPKSTERTVGAWRIQEWRLENASPVKQEKESGPGLDTAAWLDFSSIKDWSTIVHWYQDLSQPRIVPDAAVKALAADLTKDAKNDDDKIRAIVKYVSASIQYQSSP